MQNSNWGSLGDIFNPLADYMEQQRQKQDMDAILQYFGGQAGMGQPGQGAWGGTGTATGQVQGPSLPPNPLQQMGNGLLGFLGMGGQPVGLGEPRFGGDPNVNQPSTATSMQSLFGQAGGGMSLPNIKSPAMKMMMVKHLMEKNLDDLQKAQAQNYLSEAEARRAGIPWIGPQAQSDIDLRGSQARNYDASAEAQRAETPFIGSRAHVEIDTLKEKLKQDRTYGGIERSTDIGLRMGQTDEARARAEALRNPQPKEAWQTRVASENDPEGFSPGTVLQTNAVTGEKKVIATPEDAGSLKPIDKLRLANDLRQDFNSDWVYKTFNGIKFNSQVLNNAYDEGKLNPDARSTTDMTMATTFAKMLDPGSVVRESEFARTTEGVSLINRVVGAGKKFIEGGMSWTDQERDSLKKMADDIYANVQSNLNDHIGRYTETANLYGVDPKLVLGNIKPNAKPGASGPPSKTTGGQVKVKSPSGAVGYISSDELAEAQKHGWTRIP